MTIWLHGSPSRIAVGAWVLPAAELGEGRSRTFPMGTTGSDEVWYQPARVYVFDSDGIDPIQHVGRGFTFARQEHYLYVVDPLPPFGPDLDPAQHIFKSITCARARVLQCAHTPNAAASS